jgi:hypothetical protein
MRDSYSITLAVHFQLLKLGGTPQTIAGGKCLEALYRKSLLQLLLALRRAVQTHHFRKHFNVFIFETFVFGVGR